MTEVNMRDPNDRDRQQRELTEELRHDAQLRAERKRLEGELPAAPRSVPRDTPSAPAGGPEPPHKPLGTPAPGHARPDDDLGSEMPELPPRHFQIHRPIPSAATPRPPVRSTPPRALRIPRY